MQKINKNKGITLIAFVITIVILIILAGVLVNLTLGDNGLFTRSRLAKQRYEYAAAKEIVDVKLVDIQAECMTEGEEYTLDIIADRIGDNDEISTDIIHFYEIAKNKTNQSKPSAIRGMIVSANQYPKFKFLIGEEGNVVKVLGVTTGDIPEDWPENGLPEGIKTIEKFEEEIGANVVTEASGGGQTGGNEEETFTTFEELLEKNDLDASTTINQIISNQEILEKILEDSASAKYILSNNLEDICNSEDAMTTLGKSEKAKELIKTSNEYSNAISESAYWEKVYKKNIPIVKSNDTEYGIASAANSLCWNQAYAAFDNKLGSGNSCVGGSSTDFWVQFKFKNADNAFVPKVAWFYNDRDNGYGLKSTGYFSASKSDSDFVILREFSNLPTGTKNKVIIDSNEEYINFRCTLTQRNNNYGKINYRIEFNIYGL